MRRYAVLAVLLASAVARADVDLDDVDGVDDHPLARDLRAAFGRDISRCRGGECAFELSGVTCATTASGTTCRAFATVHSLSVPFGSGPRKATGAEAVRLAEHLRVVFNEGLVPAKATPTVTLARIECTSVQGESQDLPRGHCRVERQPGDAAFDGALGRLSTSDGMPMIEQCKLGAFCWTGVVRATCKADTCSLVCPAGSEDAEWLDACHLPSNETIRVEDAAFAASVRARTGRSTATIGCFTSGGSIDGGVTTLVACDVTR